MTLRNKIIFGLTMSTALAFGFLHLFIPDFPYDFDRLHIFFFNLCAGGSILLFFGHNEKKIPPKVFVYFSISLVYALTAFLNIFWISILLSIPLILIVESVRIQRFGFFPFDFFRRKPTEEKFLQASLLCLSMGITIASVVIINNEYLNLVTLEKLTIDVFFLGYSFPLSLLTFSVMYSFMKQEGSKTYMVLKEISFWSITLGVIFFFVFIIFEVTIAEILISNALLAAVIMTYYLFVKNALDVQQKWILSSGMLFLVVTGITGIVYLFEYLIPSLHQYHDLLLILHAMVALYGWNLSGLFIIVRRDDFPVFNKVIPLIVLHWLTVFILAPLGKYSIAAAVVALPLYIVLLGAVFFAKSQRETS
jgi:hypothetical protein